MAQKRTRIEECFFAPTELDKATEVEGKTKVTYYIADSTVAALDDAWLTLRKDRLSKSMIVDEAIQLALQEWELKGRKSGLGRRALR